MNQVARKQFEVRSARNAEFFRSDRPWAAISITSGDEFPALSEDNRVGLLRLMFEDITQPDTPRSFTPAQAAEILDFVAREGESAYHPSCTCKMGGDEMGMDEADSEQMKAMMPMLAGMRMAFKINTPTKIISTTAPVKSSNSAEWVFDADTDPDSILNMGKTKMEVVFEGAGVNIPEVN